MINLTSEYSLSKARIIMPPITKAATITLSKAITLLDVNLSLNNEIIPITIKLANPTKPTKAKNVLAPVANAFANPLASSLFKLKLTKPATNKINVNGVCLATVTSYKPKRFNSLFSSCSVLTNNALNKIVPAKAIITPNQI